MSKTAPKYDVAKNIQSTGCIFLLFYLVGSAPLLTTECETSNFEILSKCFRFFVSEEVPENAAVAEAKMANKENPSNIIDKVRLWRDTK